MREKQVSHVKVPYERVVTHIFMEEVDKVLKAYVMKREKSSTEKGHSERVNL